MKVNSKFGPERWLAVSKLLSNNDMVYKTAMMVVWSGLGIVPYTSLTYDRVPDLRTSRAAGRTSESRRKFRKLFRKFFDAVVAEQKQIEACDDQRTKDVLIRIRPALAQLDSFPTDDVMVGGFKFPRALLMHIDSKLEPRLPRKVQVDRNEFLNRYVLTILAHDLYKKMIKNAPSFAKKPKK